MGVQSSNVRTLEAIAVKASECEVLDRGRPFVLAGDDVIDLEGKTVLRMRYVAVLATIPGTVPNVLN